ncbi:MAG: S9 family peptidase, partial [Gemmatimonadota bacterium]
MRAVRPNLALLALAILAACQPADRGAEPAAEPAGDVPEYTIEQFLETISVFGSSFSPDARQVLVSSNESGIFNAYAIPVDGGDPIQLTASDADAIRVAGYFPEDERFLYLSDRGGDELHHLYVRELDGSVT